MIKVTEFSFVAYPVTDVKRARAFYEGVLNLKPATDMTNEGGTWVEYEIGPHTLALATYWKPEGKEGPCVSLEVEDYEGAIATLKDAGVKFDMETMDTPVCHFALIRDPDGNQIFIHQRKAPAST